MIELPLTDEGKAYGQRVKREYDRAGVRDKFKTLGHADRRWIGHAVEFELNRWLTEQGVEHVWNGGLDTKPDFVLGGTDGIKVALKANSGTMADANFTFVVPEHQVFKLQDGVLFAIVATQTRQIFIAGYLASHKFRQLAEKRKKGDKGFVAGKPFVYDCRTLSASALEPAERFFDLLRVAA